MLATKLNSHVADAQSRLLQQYKTPNTLALVGALVAGFQDLENAVFTVDAAQRIANAVGAQLDNIGAAVGIGRGGLNDLQYRAMILGTIAENNSDTTQPTILRLLQIVTGAQNVWLGTPTSAGPNWGPPHAVIGVGLGGPTLFTPLYATVVGLLAGSVAAGVGVSYIATYPASNVFSMAGPQAWVAGFGDKNVAGSGGVFAGLQYNNPSM